MELPPELRESDPPPGASWFRKLRDCLRSLRVSVAPDSGLEATPSPSGTVIGWRPGKRPVIGITAGTITKYNATTKEFGEGPVDLHLVYKNASTGKLTHKPIGGPPVTGYNGSAAQEVLSGRMVQLKPIDNYIFVDVDYCG